MEPIMAERGNNNLPINYADQLKGEAADIASRISSGPRNKITTTGGSAFVLPNGTSGPKLELVVLDFVAENNFFDRPFNRNNPFPPACFAIGYNPRDMVPSENSPDKQASSCTNCAHNQWKSGAGAGKACKNGRRLAVTPLKPMDDGTRPVWLFEIPPASIKFFDAYVSKIATAHKMSPIGMLTVITHEPGSAFNAPRFDIARPLTNEELGEVFPLREQAAELITREPDVSKYVPLGK